MRREKRLVTTQRPPGSLFKGLESTDFVYLYILLSYIQMVDAVATGRLCPSSFSSQFSGGVWSVGAGCREASTFAFTVSSASRQQTLKGGSSHWSANEVELKLVVFFLLFFSPLIRWAKTLLSTWVRHCWDTSENHATLIVSHSKCLQQFWMLAQKYKKLILVSVYQ